MLPPPSLSHFLPSLPPACLPAAGYLSCPEFLAHIEVSRNSMSERLYNVFRDGNDGISFKNFAIFGWNICATDRESLPVFAFQVYDQQGAGFLCEHHHHHQHQHAHVSRGGCHSRGVVEPYRMTGHTCHACVRACVLPVPSHT